jgi:membrane protein implicated in regulation of membrane protease activity
MADHLVWLIAGLGLIITELVSGTFFLLVIGIAAFAGAAVAWAGQGIWLQAITAAVIAVAGVVWVHHWRKGSAIQQMPPLDVGQMAVFESWVSREARQARVKYRDTTWDAHMDGPVDAQAGDVFYIIAVKGSTLEISKSRAS